MKVEEIKITLTERMAENLDSTALMRLYRTWLLGGETNNWRITEDARTGDILLSRY